MVTGNPAGRTFAALMEIAEEKQKDRERVERKAAQKAKLQHLKEIAPQEERLWQEVFRLIELKQSKPYDEAIAILQDLQALAEQQGKLANFRARVQTIQEQYPKSSSLLKRLKQAQFLQGS